MDDKEKEKPVLHVLEGGKSNPLLSPPSVPFCSSMDYDWFYDPEVYEYFDNDD